MARAILFAGAGTWTLAGVFALAVAALGTATLERLLPPLAIDTDALRAAVTALGAGLVAVGLTHVIALIGLRSRSRWGWSGATLLCAVLAATMVALCAAAVTSAVATPSEAGLLLAAGAFAALAAGAYAVAVIRLVGERRSGSVH